MEQINELKKRILENRQKQASLEDLLKEYKKDEAFLLSSLENCKLDNLSKTPRARDVAGYIIECGLQSSDNSFRLNPLQIERLLILSFKAYWDTSEDFLFCDRICKEGSYWKVENWRRDFS